MHKIQTGDIVFVKRGRKIIIGCGKVTGEYQFDEERTDKYKNLRAVKWTHKGEWDYPDGMAAMKPLTDITQ